MIANPLALRCNPLNGDCESSRKQSNSYLDTEITTFYCVRCPWKGAATRTVIFTHANVTTLLLHRCFACGEMCKQVLLNGRRPHILHVEDDADIVQVIKVLLKDMADLSNVPSVRDARKLLEEQDFDLVILDLGLADGSGIELLDEIKDGCPIIIFSAQQPDREITAQVTAALTKTTTSNDQLLATIKQALKG